MSTTEQQKPQLSAMPIVALVFSALGFCLPPLALVGFVLAIICLVRSSDPRYAPRQTLAVFALVVPIFAVFVFGILAAIAIPNFMRFQARAKQAECRSNLKSLYVAQRAHHTEKALYSTDPEELGFQPERGNRYLYMLESERVAVSIDPARSQAREAEVLAAIPPEVMAEVGLKGDCPDCEATGLCAGNIDNDETIDVWSISTADRTIDGEVVKAGEPHNHVNDLTE